MRGRPGRMPGDLGKSSAPCGTGSVLVEMAGCFHKAISFHKATFDMGVTACCYMVLHGQEKMIAVAV